MKHAYKSILTTLILKRHLRKQNSSLLTFLTRAKTKPIKWSLYRNISMKFTSLIQMINHQQLLRKSLWRWCPHQWSSVFCSVGYDEWTKWLLSLSGCCTQAWRTAPNDEFFIGIHTWPAAELFFPLKLVYSYFSLI